MILQPGSRPVPNSPDYVLVRKLGAGAFGQVWHAHGPGGLDVALKFIPHVPAQELRSLDAMKSIRHPNLVSLFGAWQKDDWLILAMELCDGSLQDRLLEALGQKLTGIPLRELLSCVSDAAAGLDALNAKQIQHRDVKPANLLLLNSGVKVADFGLAKALEHTVASNSGAGTLAYTAPECFKAKLTQQSDQYSLAVTYFHLRTGQLLFEGDQAKVMYAHLEMEPDLSGLPQAEQVVLARALSKEPAKRWPSCKLFVSELIKANQRMKEEERQAAAAEQSRDPSVDVPPAEASERPSYFWAIAWAISFAFALVIAVTVFRFGIGEGRGPHSKGPPPTKQQVETARRQWTEQSLDAKIFAAAAMSVPSGLLLLFLFWIYRKGYENELFWQK